MGVYIDDGMGAAAGVDGFDMPTAVGRGGRVELGSVGNGAAGVISSLPTPSKFKPFWLPGSDCHPVIKIPSHAMALVCLGAISKSRKFCLEDRGECTIAKHRSTKAVVAGDRYYIQLSDNMKQGLMAPTLQGLI